MKKIIVWIVCLLALLLCVGAALAQEETTIIASGSCGDNGDNLTWTLDSNGLLTIRGTGEMKDYDWDTDESDNYFITSPWYEEREKITAIQIEDGVTGIGRYAFAGCENLTAIDIPNSVTRLGENALESCPRLTRVVIPEGVTEIEGALFSGCLKLREVVLPTSVTKIGWLAFSGCASLREITLPAGVVSVGDGAFEYCTMLTTVTMQENVASIESEAFRYCDSLRNVIVYAKDALTSISEDNAFPQNEGMVFYGWANSILESWATEHGFAFRKLDDLKAADGSINWNKAEKTVWLELACVMEAGDERKLDWSVFPQTEGLSLQWSSSAPEIARVDENGVVTALKNGTATVSLTVDGKTATCEVFVGEYLDGGMCGNDVIWKLTQDGALTISGTGSMYDFEYYGSNFWSVESDRTAITSVQIEDGVTRIGNNAFGACVNIETVDIPDSVTSIGDDSFSGCESLKTISIPNGVTRIGERAFCFCTGLTAINLPDSVTRIGYLAFDNCTSLTTINIPDGVTSIELGLFSECESLTTIHLPNSVTSIDQNAFFGCKSLTTIDIPNSVTSIGDSAFWNCTSLTTISIPNGVTSIAGGALWNCTSLTTIDIPDSVTSIQSGAFYNCENLTVTLPNNVQTIGAEAFTSVKQVKAVPNTVTARVLTENNIPYWDSQLVYEGTTVVDCADDAVEAIVPDGITSIGEWAFSWNPNLKSVTLPDSVTSIGDKAFYECESLTSIDIPNGVTSIGAWTFIRCKNLVTVVMPDSVTSIGDYAFSGCESLTIILPNDIQAIGKQAFASVKRVEAARNTRTAQTLTESNTPYWEGQLQYSGTTVVDCAEDAVEVVVPDDVTSIGRMAFYNCTNLTSISIPDSVTSIGDAAFNYCPGLETISIPDSVTSIGDTAFYNCKSLKMINIPDSITSIGSFTFAGCESLTAINIPDSVTNIGDNAFYICTSLKTINISDSVTSIGNDAFGHCISLVTIDIPDSVTSIGKSMFYDCTSLEMINIPGGVTSIGEAAFHGCTSLTTISIPDGVTSIGEEAFSNCTSLATINIPDGVTSIGVRAFNDCENLTVILPDDIQAIGNRAFASVKRVEAARNTRTARILTESNTPYWDGQLQYSGTTVIGCVEDAVEAVVPDGVTSIGARAFEECSRLTTISVPDSVTSIGASAFSGCESLTVILPDNVQTVGSSAFASVERIEAARNTVTAQTLTESNTPYWDGSLQYNGTTVVGYDGKAAEVVVPDGVTGIGNSAFYNCTSLTTIVLPDGLTSIGEGAFAECSRLTTINIPDSVTSIGNSAFNEYTNLPSITLPDNITTIGRRAFNSNTRVEAGRNTTTTQALSESNIPYWDGSLQYNGTTVVDYDGKAAEVVVPDGVTSIGSSAFSGCTNLMTINLPDGVTSIDYRAFYNCPNLKWITIPESVTSIGDSVFEGCTQLRQVVFLTKDSLTDIGDAWIPSGATVYCWEYYYAETWAREKGYYTVQLLDDLLDENGNIDWSRAEKRVSLQSDCTLERGEQRQLSYGYFPTERTFGGVWSSSNPAVATVDENGVVTALQNGETVITLTEEGASATCNVRVRTTLKSFELSRSELYLPAKGTGRLSIVAMDPADSDDTFSWSISDETYATIDQEGSITAKTIGNATITVTSSSGIVRTCALHITYPVTRVAFAEASTALHPGMTRTLTANVTMRTMKCVNQMVDFSSSNESVAAVDEYGTVTAVGAGSATITATAQGNDTIRATCEITVTSEHELAVDAAVPATRTRAGLTEGSHCAICGEVLVAQETVPARTELSVLSLPAATKEIEAEAFAGSAVECAAIPDGCERIGSRAFAQCAALELAEIPASVTSIADDAFAGSEKLVIVTAEGSYAQTYAASHGIPCVAE